MVYAIELVGDRVTLPPAGSLNPEGVSWARIRGEDSHNIYARRLVEFADASYAAQGKRFGTISVSLALIPRPDNPYDADAVSIALPNAMGGDAEDRCLGYLYRHTIRNWGMDSGGRTDLIARLAAFSKDREVRFTATMSRDTDPADFDDEDEDDWDISYRVPDLQLDLPKAQIMAGAIATFLAEHETRGYGFDAADPNRGRLSTARQPEPLTPKRRWLQDLRSELMKRLKDEVVTHTDSNRHTNLQVRRRQTFATRVVNEHGGCVGVVRTNPDLVMVGSEFDRPAVIEALTREGIALPFDPAPGWLNASFHPDSSGWIYVVWVGRIAGLNVEPILAGFDVEQSELHVFAAELDAPIQGLLRRAGYVPRTVLLGDHPRDPDQFFGQDLIARVEYPPTARKLRPEVRALLPEDWAHHIEAGWRAREEVRSRNSTISQTILSSTPLEQRPPDDPQLPLGLIDTYTVGDESDETPCRLCGEALNPYAEPSPYCLDCVDDARSGLFVDLGFNEAWHPAVIWSLNQLAVIEFGGAPAQAQLRKLPKDGPNADLLMLCRMLTARSGFAVAGGERKVYSWTDWLGQAGLLADGLRTSRGVTVMAKDGHICRSLLERQIDDFFYDHGISHDIEPHYPFDAEINPDGYRADWRLSDGTYVEALGFTANPVYMAKAQRKIDLAAKYQIPIVTVTEAELPDLHTIFAKWLPPQSEWQTATTLPPRPARIGKKRKSRTDANTNGQNQANSQSRSDRLERCRTAVELQAGGATRMQISEHLGVSLDVVGDLLRDGKFYTNPKSDQPRSALAQKAADARVRGLTRAEFQYEAQLSNAKAKECWRDADVLFGEATPSQHDDH
ncbi:hypothetical protein [Mycolicibacterium sp.]|uniref:hypothetical protein n=1 Tax=Mycolicibacterium sp. TaxID=2320850 RepID=UPI0035608FAA